MPLALVAGALLLFTGGEARAGDDDNALERRIRDLEKQLAELQAQSQGGSESELEARVADLEKLTKKDKDGLFAYWKTGLRLDSADKAFQLKIGGRIMNDYTWWDSDSDTEQVIDDELSSGSEFRRVRMYMAGTIYKNTEYKLQYEFADGGGFRDVYMAFKDLIPGTKVTVGHHYQPFGLEEQTSSKYITFIERGLHTVFAPSRQTGVSIGGGDGELTWRASAFYLTTDEFGNHETDTSGDYNFAGRVTYRPWVNDDGDEWIHVGGSLALLSPTDREFRYRARPTVHLSQRFLNTDFIATDDIMTYGLELATAMGPFHGFIEWAGAEVDRITDPDDASASTSDVNFQGLTAQAGYFLTGENRPYKNGAYSRIKPKSKWGDEDGMGAFEIAGRFSTLDLNDKDVRGGEMDVWALAFNWYLNPNTRIMIDYSIIDLDREANGADADKVTAITIRFQIDF